MKALIVEDETYAIQRLRKLLEQVEWVDEIQESESGEKALQIMQNYTPDLIFLDVNLQDMTGFDVLQDANLEPKPIVVFVTAHDYALKAFEFDAFDFLLKPFKNERFFKTMEKVSKITRSEVNERFDRRVEELIRLHELKNHRESAPPKLPIKLGNKTILLDVQDIHYIAASGYYAEIFTESHKHVIRESLNHLDEILDENQFFRVHRSHIINLDYIQEIVHSNYSEIDVRMKDKKLIRVSKAQKKEFLTKIGLKQQ